MYGHSNAGNDGNKIGKRTKEKAIMHLLALNINSLTVVARQKEKRKRKKGELAKCKSLCHEIPTDPMSNVRNPCDVHDGVKLSGYMNHHNLMNIK